MKILQNHYVLAVANARASAEFFVRALGFSIVAEPPGWVFVQRDNCMIMLGECPDDQPAKQLGSHSYFAYLRVDDVDAFHKRMTELNVEFVCQIENKPWHMREFGIRTPDGHRLMIGQLIASQPQK